MSFSIIRNTETHKWDVIDEDGPLTQVGFDWYVEAKRALKGIKWLSERTDKEIDGLLIIKATHQAIFRDHKSGEDLENTIREAVDELNSKRGVNYVFEEGTLMYRLFEESRNSWSGTGVGPDHPIGH